MIHCPFLILNFTLSSYEWTEQIKNEIGHSGSESNIKSEKPAIDRKTRPLFQSGFAVRPAVSKTEKQEKKYEEDGNEWDNGARSLESKMKYFLMPEHFSFDE